MHLLKCPKNVLGHYNDRPLSGDHTSDSPVVSQCNVIIRGKTFIVINYACGFILPSTRPHFMGKDSQLREKPHYILPS